MTPPTFQRRVRHLRLRAPTHEAATHTSVLLEDALRLASWPAADSGRLVIIRRLDLGRIPPGASSASLALHLERRCREVPIEWVGHDGVDHHAAAAVAFAGRAEAVALLAQRIARRQPADEWFWPLAVSGWRPQLTRAAAWRVLLEAAVAQPAAPLVAAEIVAAATRAGQLPELAFTLTEADVPRFFTGCQWTPPPESRTGSPIRTSGTFPSPLPAREATPTSPVPPEIQAEVHRDLAAVNAPPAVRTWLAALLVVRRRPGLAALSELPRHAQELWVHTPASSTFSQKRAGLEAMSPLNPAPNTPDLESPTTVSQTATTDPPEFSDVSPDPPGAPKSDLAIGGVAPPPPQSASKLQEATPGATSPDESAEPPAPPTLPVETTAFGGLLFLVPVLTRLEFSAWLNDHPDLLGADFATSLLLSLGERVGLRSGDPLARALKPDDSRESPVADEVTSLHLDSGRPTSPEAEDGDSLPRLLRPQRFLACEPVGEGSHTHWRRAVRRWCRLEAHIGLASLIRRPARVRASRTHLELEFDLNQTDLRIRRVGLDLNPGWIPWLGRVIQFHYLNPEEHDG